MIRARRSTELRSGRSGTLVRVCAALAGVSAGTAPIMAQAPRVEVDLSASRIQYDTLASLDAPSLSSLLEWRTPTLLGRINASVTGFEGGGWSLQGRGDLAAWLAPLEDLPAVRLELAGAAATSRHSQGFGSFVTRADARVHATRGGAGLWAGAGVAVAESSFDSSAVTGLVPTVGAWARRGPVQATWQYAYTRVAGAGYPETSVVVALSQGPVDATLFAGLRRSSLSSTAYDEEWVGGSLGVWLSPNAALTLSGGRYSSDVLQGLPGGDFLSIGIRLTPRRARPVPRMVVAPIVYTAEDVRAGGIVLRVPGAEHVEIAGDWNGWQLEALEPAGDGEWRVPPSLGPGVYRFNLRIDGERWIVPDGVPEVDGGYGDRVGLLIISSG